MKTTLLLLLMSLESFAAEYNCRVCHIQLDFQVSSSEASIVVKDLFTKEIYFTEFSREIYTQELVTHYLFESRQNSSLKLEFKTSDLSLKKEKIFGFISGHYGAGFLNDSLVCIRKK